MGTVYTETVVHSAPEAFVKDAPYQLVIVELDGPNGKRLTGRVMPGSGQRRLAIGDRVRLAETTADGIAWFAPVDAAQ